jgi:dTMP kinase
LDLPAQIGFGRFAERDRLESEPLDFHERVRSTFLELAALYSDRYLVVDATQSKEDISAQILERVLRLNSISRLKDK